MLCAWSTKLQLSLHLALQQLQDSSIGNTTLASAHVVCGSPAWTSLHMLSCEDSKLLGDAEIVLWTAPQDLTGGNVLLASAPDSPIGVCAKVAGAQPP